MTKLPLRILVFALVSSIATTGQAQTIETPANTALTLTSDMNMSSGKSLQVDGTNFIKLAPSSTGNVFMGSGSGAATTSGTQNTYIGYQTSLLSTVATGNTFLGYHVFIGLNAGQNNNNGIANMFLGQRAGIGNSSGSYNSFIGSSSGETNTSGANNNFIGNGAGFSNLDGSFNVYIGSEAGKNNPSGGSNVAIGTFAGKENVNGSFNTFVGHNSNVPTGVQLQNVTVIGYNALATASNSVILGNGANVGVRITAPANSLHIGAAALANTAGIRLPITSGTPAVATNVTKFLSVNAAGDVILASLNASTREGVADAGMWQTSGDNIVNTNAGGVVIGSGVAKTPVGYKLYVAGGMLTEKVKVALRNKSEWSDFVFEKGYKLAPLSEVSAFIKANGHLPGVPSADEMVSEGLDVAKMNAKLLEKVEELTLYMLNQQKQIQKLQNDNKKIKQQLKSRR
jgi:trimeric autotransporter adhesin